MCLHPVSGAAPTMMTGFVLGLGTALLLVAGFVGIMYWLGGSIEGG